MIVVYEYFFTYNVLLFEENDGLTLIVSQPLSLYILAFRIKPACS